MFDLVYIKSEDREKLRLLREERDRIISSDKNYPKVVKEIEKIEKSRKPLKDCTMEEVIDFQKYLSQKIRIANRGGKINHATMMTRQLRMVEQQMRTIYLRTNLEQEAEAKRQEEEKKKHDAESSKAKPKPRKLQNQWTVDLGDLD